MPSKDSEMIRVRKGVGYKVGKLAKADRRSNIDYLDLLIDREYKKLPKDQQ